MVPKERKFNIPQVILPSPPERLDYLGILLGGLALAFGAQPWAQSLGSPWNKTDPPQGDPMTLAWVGSIFPTWRGGNVQAEIFTLWEGWIIRPWKSFAMIWWRQQWANCLALRGPYLLEPLFDTKVKLLGLFLSSGHCTLDDTFQASFGTKSRWFKSTFKVNVCILMAKSPHACDYLIFCCCWLNCALIFTAVPTPIRLVTGRDITADKRDQVWSNINVADFWSRNLLWIKGHS